MQITSSTNPYLGATQSSDTVQVKTAEQQAVQVPQQNSASSDTVTISAEAAAKLSDEQSVQTLGSGWGNEPSNESSNDTAPGSGWGNEPPQQ